MVLSLHLFLTVVPFTRLSDGGTIYLQRAAQEGPLITNLSPSPEFPVDNTLDQDSNEDCFQCLRQCVSCIAQRDIALLTERHLHGSDYPQ